MDLALHGTRVIVTAGAAGIGRAIIDAFLAEGARVATCDIDEEGLASLPGGVFQRTVDVADAEALRQFITDSIAEFGGLDCLVNNAGIAGPTAKIEDIGLDQWHAVVDIGLTSQFVCTQAAVAALRQSDNPSIVNLSSIAGRLGFPNRTPYSAVKWGVIGLTKSLALELGRDGIRANAILPGVVAGDRGRRVLEARAQLRGQPFAEVEAEILSRNALHDYVTPQQIADQILYLASERGRTITGQAISVCAGHESLA